jgi:dienelactone hydrolase
MATTLLSNKELPELQPATLLNALYRPEEAPLRFRAEGALDWQERTRLALRETLGFNHLPAAPLEPRLMETTDRGDHTREKILLRTSPWSVMPFYLLKPKGHSGPLPVVIAFHGHGYGVRDIVGLWEDGEERFTPEGYHKDFGIALCQAGFAVAAPEISCFGERTSRFDRLDAGQDAPRTCNHTAALASHLGGSAAGLRVMDALRLADYLETRPDLDTTRLGAMGISGGGMHTLFSVCVDTRIRACVISGYFCPWKDSIFNVNHCACNFVPGLHRFGEIHDLAGLLAPRPLLVEAGTRDPIFPLAGVKDAVERTRRIYRVFNADDQVETDIFEGRHSISGQRAYAFLKEKLA